MKFFPESILAIRKCRKVTPELLEAAYRDGMIRKQDLVPSQRYEGLGRGVKIASWSGGKQVFMAERNNGTFGSEIIRMCHPEDDNGLALFIPIREYDGKDGET